MIMGFLKGSETQDLADRLEVVVVGFFFSFTSKGDTCTAKQRMTVAMAPDAHGLFGF